MGLLSYLKTFGIGAGKVDEARILMLGLDNAGKTSILRKLSEEEILTVKPTSGFQIKTLKHAGLTLNVWDVGGQQSIRPYWRNYYTACDALIYVIDSSDRRRMEENGLELQQLLDEEKLRGVSILIFANKQDLLNSLDASEISQGLNLHSIRDRPWQIFGCSAKEGTGLHAGLEFLVSEIHIKLGRGGKTKESAAAAAAAVPVPQQQQPAAQVAAATI